MYLRGFLHKTVLLTPTEYPAIILSTDGCGIFTYFVGTKSGLRQCPIELICSRFEDGLLLFCNSFLSIELEMKKQKEKPLSVRQFLF